MGLDVYSRREYKQGKFVYLLDDEEKTAWIGKGHIGRCRHYRLPDHVMVDGQRYTVESVELGAYNHPRTLRHLVIPDTFVFVDCDTLYGLENLRSVYIGKRVEQLNNFNFRLCPKLKSIRIDKDNPHLKYENGMVLSKDGKTLWSTYTKRPHTIYTYEPANTEDNPIDYCLPHCAMRLTGKVSARMRNKLEGLRAKVMSNEGWQQKFISHRLITEL